MAGMGIGATLSSLLTALTFVAAVGEVSLGGALCDISEIADCEDAGTNEVYLQGNGLQKFNETVTLYSPNLTLPYQIGDNLQVFLSLSVFNNGRWQENVFRKNFGGICTLGRMFAPSLYNSLLKKAGRKRCPVPPGDYQLQGISFPIKLTWLFLPLGTFKNVVTFIKDDVTVGCKTFYIEIIPDRSS
ncbi:hypothetical protein AAG570_006105 [Ranatra chinensis]|uniref:Uncharacterized protein n=1 Tax=Ranatra chinensis TaxID=642074 RepID=A0ABD0XYU3_9HEMI